MRRPKVSIGRLMVLVLLLALIFAAMMRPTRLGASLAYSGALLATVATTIVARFGRKASRPFAAGFAIAGWTSLVVHFGVSLAPPDRKATFDDRPAPVLPTIAVLDVIYARIVSKSDQSASLPANPTPSASSGPTVGITMGSSISVGSSGEVTLSSPPSLAERPAAFWSSIDRGEGGVIYYPPRSPSFLTSGIAFFTIGFGWLAGGFAQWVRSRAVTDKS